MLALVLWSAFCVMVGCVVTAVVYSVGVVNHDEERLRAELDAEKKRRADDVARLAAYQLESKRWPHEAPTHRP